jgi:hypothetical protein
VPGYVEIDEVAAIVVLCGDRESTSTKEAAS